jgi:hypothetical protein
MKPRAEYVVYIAGVVPLAIFYGEVKEAIGSDGLFLLLVLIYLLALRALGKGVAHLLAARAKVQ